MKHLYKYPNVTKFVFKNTFVRMVLWAMENSIVTFNHVNFNFQATFFHSKGLDSKLFGQWFDH
jgi:hypothetical protein